MGGEIYVGEGGGTDGRLGGKIIGFLCFSQAGAADKSILSVLFVWHYKIRKLFFNEHETAEE